MLLKKILISAMLLSALSLSFVSCSEEDDKSSDSFTIEPQDSSSDPLNSSDIEFESSSNIVVHTTVYEDMEEAYLSMVNGDVEQWEKYRDTMYIILSEDYGTTDTDGDGLPDAYEIEIMKTDPEKADTDGDGYDDCVEDWMHTDPLTPND